MSSFYYYIYYHYHYYIYIYILLLIVVVIVTITILILLYLWFLCCSSSIMFNLHCASLEAMKHPAAHFHVKHLWLWVQFRGQELKISRHWSTNINWEAIKINNISDVVSSVNSWFFPKRDRKLLALGVWIDGVVHLSHGQLMVAMVSQLLVILCCGTMVVKPWLDHGYWRIWMVWVITGGLCGHQWILMVIPREDHALLADHGLIMMASRGMCNHETMILWDD